MIELRQTDEFKKWLSGLRDSRAKQKIAIRLRRLAFGHAGDVKPVGAGISELRIPEGKGYRVYYTQQGELLILLLMGGNKATQSKDITKARALLDQWKETNI